MILPFRRKLIVFKLNSFAEVSETFIVSNIIEAIGRGYEVAILTKRKNEISQSSQKEILQKYNLLNRIVVLKKPTHWLKRILFAFYCLLQPIVFYCFVKQSVLGRRLDLNLLYRMHYWYPYRNANVIHVHFGDTAEELPLLKKIDFLKGKLIVTFHGYDGFFKNDKDLERLKKQYELLFQMADRITVNTSYLKGLVQQLGCPLEKLKIIPVGVKLDFFEPVVFPKRIEKGETIRLISVGRIIELKGHLYGIRVVKNLIDQGFSVKYTIIGEGILLEKLKKEVIDMKLTSHVYFWGRGTQEQIKAELDQSHLFLMTSIEDSRGRQEAQGVVTLEAQAMGLPVVAFDSGGVAATVSEKSAVLVRQKDTLAMATAVKQIIESSEKYRSMSLAARNWVKTNFAIESMVANYYNEFV